MCIKTSFDCIKTLGLLVKSKDLLTRTATYRDVHLIDFTCERQITKYRIVITVEAPKKTSQLSYCPLKRIYVFSHT